MDGETLKMVIKTLYGVVPYTGTMMLALIWMGIAIGSLHGEKAVSPWLLLALAGLSYAGLFLMLAIISSGNPLFGMEINAWFNRSFALLGCVFLSIFTALYLAKRWRHDNGHDKKESDA